MHRMSNMAGREKENQNMSVLATIILITWIVIEFLNHLIND